MTIRPSPALAPLRHPLPASGEREDEFAGWRRVVDIFRNDRVELELSNSGLSRQFAYYLSFAKGLDLWITDLKIFNARKVVVTLSI